MSELDNIYTRECIMNKENATRLGFSVSKIEFAFALLHLLICFLSVKNYFYKMKDVPEGFSV